MALWGAKSDKVALLRKVAFFDGLTAQQLTQVARLADEAEVEAGRRLARAGDTGKELFIIVDGEALVRPARGRAIRLGRGDFFGEMSLIDGAPRSATVEATTPMRLLVVGQREFWQLLATAPAISRRIMHAMAERLREANAAYSANP
jgi:CRP-like cAMP-binding protein